MTLEEKINGNGNKIKLPIKLKDDFLIVLKDLQPLYHRRIEELKERIKETEAYSIEEVLKSIEPNSEQTYSYDTQRKIEVGKTTIEKAVNGLEDIFLNGNPTRSRDSKVNNISTKETAISEYNVLLFQYALTEYIVTSLEENKKGRLNFNSIVEYLTSNGFDFVRHQDEERLKGDYEAAIQSYYSHLLKMIELKEGNNVGEKITHITRTLLIGKNTAYKKVKAYLSKKVN